MSKRKHKPGTFLMIPLADGTFGYGRTIEWPYTAFYNYRTPFPEPDLDKIASAPVLFKIGVRQVARSGWETIGWRKLESLLTQPVVQFWQDIGDFRDCIISDTAGLELAAEPHECTGLERAAAWEEYNVEERLLDTFMGRPNASVEHLKVRLS